MPICLDLKPEFAKIRGCGNSGNARETAEVQRVQGSNADCVPDSNQCGFLILEQPGLPRSRNIPRPATALSSVEHRAVPQGQGTLYSVLLVLRLDVRCSITCCTLQGGSYNERYLSRQRVILTCYLPSYRT